ncbi:MAG: tRNA epoxyqueuosine(34) reductase QueG [Bacteroidales bacterium]|nr:tRNA epoxyqueuosine(34) reductase QueG [Bacteroidales bacterium]
MNAADPSFSQFIVAEAERLGFAACGISCATSLEKESAIMERWLEADHEGEMSYLNRNKEKRYDPRLLVEGTRSIVTVLYNYYPQQLLPQEDNYKIAKYAYGEDYHEVLKQKMRELLSLLESHAGPLQGTRVFVDSAPVLDRAWAVKCGLGFIGKNTSLIHPKMGSFFFIGHLFLPIELVPTGSAMDNRCGRCTRCLDACPTGALTAPFTLDARRCISYLTIEYKGELKGDPSAFNDWMYGCDICQDVCPYNKFAIASEEPRFRASERLMAMRKGDWKRLDEATFDELFRKSAVQRAGYEGLRRNIDFMGRE